MRSMSSSAGTAPNLDCLSVEPLCFAIGSFREKNLAPATINVRLAAVRRLAHEASDTGLRSPELAAGIRRVKGAKRLGVRIGNWLTIEQARDLLQEKLSRVSGARVTGRFSQS
jgi:hypothetical protein